MLQAVLASNVRAERARRGWRQADLAAALGWSPTTVADIEGGRRRLDVDQLTDLCRAFGIPLGRLLQDGDPDALQVLGLT
jgi:transcriptional regulator with XRE-family HTH domain